jgi:hypothetical protein
MLEEVGVQAEFIAIRVGYKESFLFPVEQGLKYIKSLRGCLVMKTEGYGENKIIHINRFDEDLTMKFFSKEEIQELIASQELLLRGKSNENS